MSNIHFSGLDKVKITCITQFSFEITIRKHMFTLTFVDREKETSISIFRNLRSWKALFSHHSVLPNELCTNEIKVLEVSNSVRNWNKVKNFIFVELKLELCQLEMLICIYKLMCQSSLINLFHFCSVNLIV